MKLAKGASAGTTPALQPQDLPRESAVLLARQDEPRPTTPETIAPATTPPPARQAPSPASRARLLAAAPAPSAPAATAPNDSFTLQDSSATWRYRFARQSETDELVAAKKDMAASALLSTFEFEQVGDGVRVIDRDGSVYAGRVELHDLESSARLGETKSQDKRLGTESLERRKPAQPAKIVTAESVQRYFVTARNGRAATNFSFRVAGTNRTSGQLITFEGTFSDTTDTARARDRSAVRPAPAPPRGAPSAQPAGPPALNAPTGAATTADNSPVPGRIIGRLRMGSSNEVSIIALPVAK